MLPGDLDLAPEILPKGKIHPKNQTAKMGLVISSMYIS